MPIYNATSALDKSFNKLLSNIDTLPRCEADIPENSYAAVSFTVSHSPVTNKSSYPTIAFNLQWAMLIMSP